MSVLHATPALMSSNFVTRELAFRPTMPLSNPTLKPPTLGMSPARHTRCCLSLSRPIVDMIVSHLPATAALALSIGSGSGLLEQLIRTTNPHLDFYGVEVAGAENM